MSRVALLCAEPRGRVDAIHDATRCLGASLRDLGLDAQPVERRGDGSWHDELRSWRDLSAVANDHDTLMLQYNPFLYGRRGFAPWLIGDFVRLRSRRHRPQLLLYVHETAMPMIGWRKTLMGAWQRVQLRAIRATSDTVFATTETWTEQLSRRRPRRRTIHLPVGSTLPDMRTARDATRATLGALNDRLVVATMSSGHESHLVDYTAAAVGRIATETPDMLLLTLGAGAKTVSVQGIEIVAPGALPADELAALVAASDLFLAPLIDGISTRRTSMMAALQHGVAVIATDGHLTDAVLRDSNAVRLSKVGDVDAFAAAASAVALDPVRRAGLAAAGLSLYERAFDWPMAARAVAATLETR